MYLKFQIYCFFSLLWNCRQERLLELMYCLTLSRIHAIFAVLINTLEIKKKLGENRDFLALVFQPRHVL